MINFYLKFLKLLRPIFIYLKVDFNQLLAIVEVKLKMDNRRPKLNQATNNKESNSTLWVTMLMYSFLSSLFGLIILIGKDIIVAPYSLIFGFIMLMLGMILVSDFSAVLLDSNDNAILLPRPIDSKTMQVARIVHIMLYLLSLMLALTFPFIVITLIKYGFFPAFIFLIINFLALVLIVFTTNIFYLIVMKFTSEERLRNLINYFQIAFTILLTIGYQIISKFFGTNLLSGDTEIAFRWWHILLPPIWMGNFMEAVIHSNFSTSKVLFILLTIIIPLLAFVGLKRFSFSNIFNEKIAGMDITSTNVIKKSSNIKQSFVEKISSFFTNNSIEKGAFEFVWKYSGRDRKFKLRIYPSLAYMLLYPFIIVFNSQEVGNLNQKLEHLQNSPYSALMLIYISLMIISTIHMQITQTEEYKSAWIFQIAPLEQPGQLLSGSYKAVLVKFIFPVLIICTILLLSIWGINYLDDLLFGLFTVINLNLLINLGTKNHLPFSKPVIVNAGNSFLKTIGYMITAVLIGLFHYFLMKLPYVIAAFALFQLIILIYLFKKYKELGWEKVSLE